MGKIQITVKEVDEEAFKELKAAAARDKMTMGGALSLAIHVWISQSRKKEDLFSSLKPVSYGPGTERLSEQIDEVIYGGE